MIHKLLLPQEIETFYVIPAVRRYLAIALKERGMKQRDIAGIMNINTAAVSQYFSDKRGHKVTFSPDLQREITKSATHVRDRMSYIRETLHILDLLRATRTLCDIHRQFSDVPKECHPHLVGCHPRKYPKTTCTWQQQ